MLITGICPLCGRKVERVTNNPTEWLTGEPIKVWCSGCHSIETPGRLVGIVFREVR